MYGTLTPSKSNDAAYIKLCFDVLPQGTITESTWAEWTKKIKELSGKKGKELFMPLRQALTGMDHGPEMKKLIVLMGYHQVCTRLKTQFTI